MFCGVKVIELHRNGVSLSAGDRRGWRPLHYAARHGHKEVVRYIISNGMLIQRPIPNTSISFLTSTYKHGHRCVNAKGVLIERPTLTGGTFCRLGGYPPSLSPATQDCSNSRQLLRVASNHY